MASEPSCDNARCCVTGILVDLSDTSTSDHISCKVDKKFRNYSMEEIAAGEMCDRLLADEIFNFDFSLLQENHSMLDEMTSRRSSILSPRQMAELFEQANTVAVRLKMAADENTSARGNRQAFGVDAEAEDGAVSVVQSDTLSALSTTSCGNFLEVPKFSIHQTVDKQICHELCSDYAKENVPPATERVPIGSSSIVVKSVDRAASTTESRRFMIPKKSVQLPVARKRNLSNLSSVSASSGCSVVSNTSTISSETLKDATVSVKPKISRSVSSKTASKPVVLAAKSRQSLYPIVKSQRCVEPKAETKPTATTRGAMCAKPLPSKSALKVKPLAVRSSSDSCSDIKKQSVVKQISKVAVKPGIAKSCAK